MEKKFKMVGEELKVTVEAEDKLILPINGVNIEVGSYTQTTVQTIIPEHIKTLKDFIGGEKEKADAQIVELESQLVKFKDVHGIPEDVMGACAKKINKGSKEFNKTMKPLNDAIIACAQKKQIESQIEFITEGVKDINSDYDKIMKI